MITDETLEKPGAEARTLLRLERLDCLLRRRNAEQPVRQKQARMNRLADHRAARPVDEELPVDLLLVKADALSNVDEADEAVVAPVSEEEVGWVDSWEGGTVEEAVIVGLQAQVQDEIDGESTRTSRPPTRARRASFQTRSESKRWKRGQLTSVG